MANCNCPSPIPGWNMHLGVHVCGRCKGVVQPLVSKRPPPDFTPCCTPDVMVKPKWFAFECPECEHEEVYFQQQVTPEGTAVCHLCGAEVKAETIIEICERRERQYREKIKNPMMRTLDLAPGTHGKRCGEDEE